jgi:hypothetical protein
MDREICGAHPELVRNMDQRFDRIEATLEALPDRIAQATRSGIEQRLELHLLRAHPGVGVGQIMVPPAPKAVGDPEESRLWLKALIAALLTLATIGGGYVSGRRSQAQEQPRPAAVEPAPHPATP